MYRILAAVLVFAGALGLGFTLTTSNDTPEVIEQPASPSPVIRPLAFKAPVTNITISKPSLRDISVFYFNVEVNGFTTNVAIELLHRLAKRDKTIYFVIDSPGGSVFDGTRLMSHMKGLSVPVNTVCEGICASMGAHLFQSGKQRLMLDKSVLMFHPAAGGVQGTVPEMRSLLNLIDSYTQRMDMETAKRSNIPYDKFERMVIENLWVEAQDAIAMGLADGYVVIPPGEFEDNAGFIDLRREMNKRSIVIKHTENTKLDQLDNFR